MTTWEVRAQLLLAVSAILRLGNDDAHATLYEFSAEVLGKLLVPSNGAQLSDFHAMVAICSVAPFVGKLPESIFSLYVTVALSFPPKLRMNYVLYWT